jgi:hypothetical protein
MEEAFNGYLTVKAGIKSDVDHDPNAANAKVSLRFFNLQKGLVN